MRDPIIAPNGGGRSSSDGYQLYSSISQLIAGQSSSTLFIVKDGFQYYPEVVAPIVTATAASSSVALSWTAASAELAGDVTEYKVGQSTVSGNSYSFTSVGTATTTTVNNLSAGVPYYFVIRAFDAQGNVIVTSGQVSATPPAVTTPVVSNSGGGGSGGVSYSPLASVVFSGTAYPGAAVFLLEDGQQIASIIAGTDGQFSITIASVSYGAHTFDVVTEDRSSGMRSTLTVIPVEIAQGKPTSVGGITIAPSVSVGINSVRRGETITVFGQAAPGADIILSVKAGEEFFGKTKADKTGMYTYSLSTGSLTPNTYVVRAQSSLKGMISDFGIGTTFVVSDTVTSVSPERVVACPSAIRGDFNGDCRVNMVDFSVLAYWYKRPSPSSLIDINGDGTVTLKDFSILVFYWIKFLLSA